MIRFESEVQRRKLRVRLQAVTDWKLIRYGLALRHAKTRRVSGALDRADEFVEAREEWGADAILKQVRFC